MRVWFFLRQALGLAGKYVSTETRRGLSVSDSYFIIGLRIGLRIGLDSVKDRVSNSSYDDLRKG